MKVVRWQGEKGGRRERWQGRGGGITAQKLKFSIKDFFRKCDQIRSFLREVPGFIQEWGTQG